MSDKDKDPIEPSNETSQKEVKEVQNQETTESLASTDDNEAHSSSTNDSETSDKTSLDLAEDGQQDLSSTSPKQKPKSSKFKLIVLLIILIGLAYLGYWIWQQWKVSQAAVEKADQVTLLQQQLNDHTNQLEKLLATSNSQKNTANQIRTELEQKIVILNEQLQTSQRKFQSINSEQEAVKQKQWMLAEAEYLIRQAARKLHYSDDAQSIIALLQSADQQILQMADSNLLSLRNSIANDINKIRASGAIDTDGVLVKIDSLQQQLSELPLASVQLQKSDSEEVKRAVEQEESAWQSFKNNISEVASDMYTVHNYDETVKPFINPKQDTYLRQNMQLNLKMAQLFALRHKQKSYDLVLAEVKSWTREYFKQNSNTTQAFSQQLEEIISQSVALDLPKALTSLDVIKSVNTQQFNQWLKQDLNSGPQKPAAAAKSIDEAFENSGELSNNLNSAGNIEEKIKKSIQKLEKTKKDDDKQNGDQK